MTNERIIEQVKLAQTGNDQAFEELVRHFQDRAVAYAASILGDVNLAQDVAQEAFIEVYRILPSLRSPAAFASWLRKIIFKHCERMTRGKHLETEPLENAVYVSCSAFNPEKLSEQREIEEQIQTAIQSLPVTQREVITLFYMGEHSHLEIAEFLALPVSTIKSRLHEGRNRLKGRIMTMIEGNLYDNRPSKDGQFSQRVMAFTRNFSGMIDGGQSIVRSLLDLAEQQADAEMKDALTRVRLAVQEGATLSMAMAEFPNVFSVSYVESIRRGEQGDLRGMLQHLAS